jgi:hypothetical protein
MTRRSRYVRLTLPRRLMRDVLQCAPIFLKAVALTAKRFPELRRSYMPLPWPHFYEHPDCVAAIVVEREWRGERAVLADQILAPDRKTLFELDGMLRSLKELPVEAVGGFRRILRIAGYPRPLRWLLLRLALYGSGRLRSRYIGTFVVNSIPVRRFYITQSRTLPAIAFFYGPIEPNGEMPINVYFDHRVIDGVRIGRLLSAITTALNHEIIAELEGRASVRQQ